MSKSDSDASDSEVSDSKASDSEVSDAETSDDDSKLGTLDVKAVDKATLIPNNNSLSTDDLLNVAIVRINDKYSYGKYGPVSIIIRNKDRYVNGTRICSDAGRHFKRWKQTNRTQEYVKFLMKKLDMKQNSTKK